jgi:L-amino acid N-acyltransferase YncA
MNTVDCTLERHGAAIRDIFNDAIANTTALFEYAPRTSEVMGAWFAARAAGGFPVIGLEDEGGTLAGFATYGTFRAFPAFKYSVEHSVYVHRDHRGRGHGRRLLAEIVARAQSDGRHLVVGGIEAGNTASIALHESLGFTHAGTIREAGFKFGRWLDLAFYQRHLPTPEDPKDG